MFRVSAEGLNHYTVVYGLYCRRLQDSVVDTRTHYWNMMYDCFRGICNIGTGYKGAKGYCRCKYNTPEALTITEVKTTKKPELCYKCRGPHFQSNCTNLMGNNSHKFQNRTLAQQNYMGNNYKHEFFDNKSSSNMFPTGTLSFQATQQIRSGDEMSLNIDIIKCFLIKRRKNIASRTNQITNIRVQSHQNQL